jgi:hypothetical protein
MPLHSLPAELLSETTSPAVDWTFDESTYKETGIDGFQYLLYDNYWTLWVWEQWAEDELNDVANRWNVGVYDSEASRMIVTSADPLETGDYWCIGVTNADLRLE